MFAGFLVNLQVKTQIFEKRMSQDKQNQIEEPAMDDVQQQQPTGSDFGGYEKLITLSPREHIRQRPGMYIGKLGDGSQNDDGV